MSGFAIESFNAILPDMEAAFTEDWTIGNTTWPAISIDKMAAGSRVMKGGKFLDVNTQIFVRLSVFTDSGVKNGSLVTARGQNLAVIEIDDDGDESRTLICGPAQINVW